MWSLNRLSLLIIALMNIGVLFFAMTAVQQDYRMSANDPQIQITEDTTRQLSGGAPPAAFVADLPKIDLRDSLAVFMLITDERGTLLAGSATLDGQTVLPPQTALSVAKDHGQSRFTWQPNSNIREALVVQYYHSARASGYIMVGRSLREVEQRESNLNRMALIALLGVIVLTGILWSVPRHRAGSA